MANAWGDSWGDAWGDSWGSEDSFIAGVSAVAGAATAAVTATFVKPTWTATVAGTIGPATASVAARFPNTASISATVGAATASISAQFAGQRTASVAATVGAATMAVAATFAGPVTAAFTGGPTSGTEPLSVQFTDQSTGSPTSWLWDFGDGAVSTLQNPSHTYQFAGSYTVTLEASNSAYSDVLERIAYVLVEVPVSTGGLSEGSGADGGWLVPPQWGPGSEPPRRLPTRPFVDVMEEARKLKRRKILEIVAALESADMV